MNTIRSRILVLSVAVAAPAGLAAAFLPAWAGPQSASLAPEQAEQTTPYRLAPGDKIKVTVRGRHRLSGTFEVASNQTVSLPRIGDVQAGGLTVVQLETAVEGKLRERHLKNPHVVISVAKYRPFYVIGEVKEPGRYPFASNLTIREAVALGGGFTEGARTGTMFLTRAADPERREEAVPPDTIVQPGDVIRVPERFF